MTHYKKKIRFLFQIKTILLAGFFLVSTLLIAQSSQQKYQEQNINQRDFDTQKWKEITSGLDYSGQPQPIEQSDSTDTFGEEGRVIPKTNRESGIGSGIFQAFAILAGIGVAVMIILYLLNQKGIVINRKVKKTEITLENIEEHIHETRLDGFIREAKESGNYALATRLYYLAIIKELSIKKRIKWKRDKTNGEYLREVRGSIFFTPFSEATQIFENIWYGEETVNEEDFLRLEPKFKGLVDAVART